MASEVKLPRLGQGMEAGTIVKWLKSEGDRVERGEPLYELDTDKATQEVEAEASGVLLRIAVEAGEVPVGQTVAVIGEEGEAVVVEAGSAQPAEAPDAAPAHDGERPADAGVAGSPRGDGQASARAGGRVKASPLARRIARERGIELAALTGTGPDGRIVAEDVERAGVAPGEPQVAPPALEEPVTEPLSPVRRTIARRLTAAWEVPVFVLGVSAEMTAAESLLQRLRGLEPDQRVTVTDLLVKASAQALRRHPELNVSYTDEALLLHQTANVGIAVAAPQGLVVPVVRSAERLSLAEIAARTADLVGRARERRLAQADLEGGTFTISNLGMYGVERFEAVLNPPQAAILAVGAAEERPVVRDGRLVARSMLSLTLTVDHRAVDGAPAAEFLRTVKTYLEEPALAL